LKTIKNNAIIIENDIFQLSNIVTLSYDGETLYVYLHNNKSYFYYKMNIEKSKYYLNLYKSTFDKIYE